MSDIFEPATAGAMCTSQTDVLFSGNSLIKLTNNAAGGGGAAVFSSSNVIIEEYSTVMFINNIAHIIFGAAFTCYNSSNVTLTGNSNVFFISNKANQDGGALYSYKMCTIIHLRIAVRQPSLITLQEIMVVVFLLVITPVLLQEEIQCYHLLAMKPYKVVALDI